MSLRDTIQAYIMKVRGQPSAGGDPKELMALEQSVIEDPDGLFGALSIPVARRTWMQSTVLLGATAESTRIPLVIPRAGLIVGCQPIIEVIGANGVTPTLASLQVRFDLDQEEFLTAAQGQTTVGAAPAQDGQFVSLAAMGTNQQAGSRLLMWRIPSTVNSLGMTFRWVQGAGVYKDTFIMMNWYFRPDKAGPAGM
jgi:hypothetical protein